MPYTIGRRGVLRGAGTLAAAGALPATLPWDLALAQGASPNTTLRIGMTASAVPLPNGMPDQGAEGHRFMGITLFDHLVMWDLSQGDKAAPLRPGLATAWKPDPDRPEALDLHPARGRDASTTARSSTPRTWSSPTTAPSGTTRPSSTRAAPPRRAAACRPSPNGTPRGRTPSSSRRARSDSQVPYGATWIGITHKAAWEAAGRDWDKFMQHAVGTGPWKLESFSIRERAVLVRNPDYWEEARIPKVGKLVLLSRCRSRIPASPRCAPTRWTSSRRRRPTPSPR